MTPLPASVTYTTQSSSPATNTDPFLPWENRHFSSSAQDEALVAELSNELTSRNEDLSAVYNVPRLRASAVKTLEILNILLALRDNIRVKKIHKENKSIATTFNP